MLLDEKTYLPEPAVRPLRSNRRLGWAGLGLPVHGRSQANRSAIGRRHPKAGPGSLESDRQGWQASPASDTAKGA